MSCYSIISIQFQCGYCLKGVRMEREKQRRTPTFNPPITFCSLLPFEIRELSKEVKFLEKKTPRKLMFIYSLLHFSLFQCNSTHFPLPSILAQTSESSLQSYDVMQKSLGLQMLKVDLKQTHFKKISFYSYYVQPPNPQSQSPL